MLSLNGCLSPRRPLFAHPSRHGALFALASVSRCCVHWQTGCRQGWRRYDDPTRTNARIDVKYVEGQSSCVKLITNVHWQQYAEAKVKCEDLGAHLVTMRGVYSAEKHLSNLPPRFLLDWMASVGVSDCWVGAEQAVGFGGKAEGWSWIDGTDAGNLNGGARGSGVWYQGEPRQVPIVVCD